MEYSGLPGHLSLLIAEKAFFCELDIQNELGRVDLQIWFLAL